jgi:hypothetical protein
MRHLLYWGGFTAPWTDWGPKLIGTECLLRTYKIPFLPTLWSCALSLRCATKRGVLCVAGAGESVPVKGCKRPMRRPSGTPQSRASGMRAYHLVAEMEALIERDLQTYQKHAPSGVSGPLHGPPGAG